jgi:hypothetical protein
MWEDALIGERCFWKIDGWKTGRLPGDVTLDLSDRAGWYRLSAEQSGAAGGSKHLVAEVWK